MKSKKGIGLFIIIVSIITFLLYILFKLVFERHLFLSSSTLLDQIIGIITILTLLIAPISIGKLLTIIDISQHNNGIGKTTRIFLWIEILTNLGKILIAASLINLSYAFLKIIFFVNPINEVNRILTWSIILIFGLITSSSAKKIRKKV
jgi:hypothetical protein